MAVNFRGAALALVLPMVLAGCGSDKNDQDLDKLDNELVDTANSGDAAVNGALNDQIMVDPSLAGQSNDNAVRPPAQPYADGVPGPQVAARARSAIDQGKLIQAPAPAQAKTDRNCTGCKSGGKSATLGAMAEQQNTGNSKDCTKSLQYSARWAERLPAGLPLFPGAHVSEAAGTNDGTCSLRVVSFRADQPVGTMVNWYYTHALESGYNSEHQVDGEEHILGGTRKRDDGAYVLFMTPHDGGGTSIDLIANNGR